MKTFRILMGKNAYVWADGTLTTEKIVLAQKIRVALDYTIAMDIQAT